MIKYKNKCVSCGTEISPRAKHHNKYGNYCAKCSKRATGLSLKKELNMFGYKRTKKGTIVGPRYYKGEILSEPMDKRSKD